MAQFAACVSRGLCNPRLIFPRINRPSVIFKGGVGGYGSRHQDWCQEQQWMTFRAMVAITVLLAVRFMTLPLSVRVQPTANRARFVNHTVILVSISPTPRKYVFDVTSVGQRSSPHVNSVKVEINFTSSASSIFLVHNL